MDTDDAGASIFRAGQLVTMLGSVLPSSTKDFHRAGPADSADTRFAPGSVLD
jgi:hypothetical protein